MDALIDPLLQPITREIGGRWLIGWALTQYLSFFYVLFRIAGLMIVGPFFGNKSIPMNAKALLAAGLAIMLTPTLAHLSQVTFARLDANRDGWISEAEVPTASLPRFHRRVAELDRSQPRLRATEWTAPPPIPQNVIDWARIGITEFGVGIILGLAATTVLAGLQLAGELIDQQTGIALSEIFNPSFEELDGSVTGRFLMLFGTTVFLVMSPVDGHLRVLGSLIETFYLLPIGEAELSPAAVDLLSNLVHAALILALQVAAPVLAAMSLVALGMGFLGHSVPQLNVFNFGFPVRALVNLGILALTFSGASASIIDALVTALDGMRYALIGESF